MDTEMDRLQPHEGRDLNKESTSLNSGMTTGIELKTSFVIQVSQNPMGHPEEPQVLGCYGVITLEWHTESKARNQKIPSVTKFSFNPFVLGNTKIKTNQQVDLELYGVFFMSCLN